MPLITLVTVSKYAVRTVLLFLVVGFIPQMADAVEDLRLLNPPAVRMLCLPSEEAVEFEPVNLGPIPTGPTQRKAYLANAARQNITIGLDKFGPFDEDKGTFQASCTVGKHKVMADFSYTNYPSTRSAEGIALLADGQCDELTHLELTRLTVDGESWGAWSEFLHYCRTPQVLKLTVHPKQRLIKVCTLPTGGGPGYRFEPVGGTWAKTPSQTTICRTQAALTP